MTTASSEDWAKQNTTSVLLRRTGGYVRDVTCWVASTTHTFRCRPVTNRVCRACDLDEQGDAGRRSTTLAHKTGAAPHTLRRTIFSHGRGDRGGQGDHLARAWRPQRCRGVAVGPTTTDAVHDVAVTADDPGPKGASLHDVTMHLDWGQPSFGALLHLVLPHGALNTVNNATTCPQKPKSQGVPWYTKSTAPGGTLVASLIFRFSSSW